jgi:hypothetical protein
VTYKTGFGFHDRIYWIFIQLVTFHKPLSSTGHSLLLITGHQSTNLSLLQLNYSSQSHSLLYSLGYDLMENISIVQQLTSTVVLCCCRLYLVTDCLRRICLRGKVFIEPLCSNGHVSQYYDALWLCLCTRSSLENCSSTGPSYFSIYFSYSPFFHIIIFNEVE